MEDVLTEVMALFPGPYIHTGGDEAPKDQWKTSPRAQTKLRELSLPNENALQSWFTKQIDVIPHRRTAVASSAGTRFSRAETSRRARW